MIFIYNVLTTLLLPLYILILLIRVIKGKEDVTRIKERFGIGSADCRHPEHVSESKGTTTSSRARFWISRGYGNSDEILNQVQDYSLSPLIWIHAASVGESMMAITLIEAINARGKKCKFLVTSGTKASAAILGKRLAPNSIHQYVPADNFIFVRNFLRFWQPDLGVFIEAELWPTLISEGAKCCKLLLLNARISDQSFKNWQRFKTFFQAVTSHFTEIITQSQTDLQKFRQLGMERAKNFGNLKFANPKLRVDAERLTILQKCLEGKKIIVIASTHSEDERVVLPLIKPLKLQYRNSYFILVLRHPHRLEQVAKNCADLGLSFKARSQSLEPSKQDDLYIVDKMGELGLFYSLADISFVGGSFAQGGHNPIEPAHFGNFIMFGPDMSNFFDIANEMLAKKCAVQIKNQKDLLDKLQYFLSSGAAKEIETFKINALEYTKHHRQILENYLEVILSHGHPELGSGTLKEPVVSPEILNQVQDDR